MNFHFFFTLSISNLVTARVRTYDGRLCFHRCVSVQLWGGGYPVPSIGRGGTPSQVWLGEGLPHLRSGGGTPSQVQGGYPISGPGGGVPPPGIASTCYGYAAGNIPLAFTQEDFLVNSFVAYQLNKSRKEVYGLWYRFQNKPTSTLVDSGSEMRKYSNILGHRKWKKIDKNSVWCVIVKTCNSSFSCFRWLIVRTSLLSSRRTRKQYRSEKKPIRFRSSMIFDSTSRTRCKPSAICTMQTKNSVPSTSSSTNSTSMLKLNSIHICKFFANSLTLGTSTIIVYVPFSQ